MTVPPFPQPPRDEAVIRNMEIWRAGLADAAAMGITNALQAAAHAAEYEEARRSTNVVEFKRPPPPKNETK